VIALSRTDRASIDSLVAWVLAQLAEYRTGSLVAVDPGPMAAHSYSHSHDHPHDHSHTH
jgi:urease accessory protein